MGFRGCEGRLDVDGEFVIAVWLHGTVLQSWRGLRQRSGDRDRPGGNGGEAAATGLPLPPSSSDSPALRRGDEVRNSRSFERFAPEGPGPPLFLFFFSSAAVEPPMPTAVAVAF